jgi:uncharacterized damage-inducible protein DinB
VSIVGSIDSEYQRYKKLADAALEQVSDEELFRVPPGGSNSLDMIVRHIAGNLRSRFSDFRTADGEKGWRRRDDEFEPAAASRAELLRRWEEAWAVLFAELRTLTDTDLAATVTIRHQPLRIDEALHRSLAHTAYHVGQVVYVAKAMRSDAWRCLSIPRGMSEALNQKMAQRSATPGTPS